MSRLPLVAGVVLLVSACGGGGSGDDNPNPPDAMQTSNVCSNGIDDDNDGSTDYPADPGCDSPTDADESNPPIAQCMDGRDNDGDGKTDYPEDPGCFVQLQNSELDDCPDGPNCPICSNGLDDDEDGHTDYPDDDGCTAASGQDEFGTDPNACGPGLIVTRLDTPTVSGMLTGTSHLTSDQCGGGGGEVPYELIITEPSVIVATTDFIDTTVDTSLYLRSDCLTPSTELVCNDNATNTTLNSTITVSVAPGRYYLIVDARTIGETGNFKLGYSLFAGEGTPCVDQSECGPGLQCRVPMGGTDMICTTPVCADAVDDDGDGFNDYPDDPGCETPGDFDEVDDCPSGPDCPACSNDLDDDGDGAIDFGPGGDPDCLYAAQPAEGCNNESDPISVMTTATVTGSTSGFTNDFEPSCAFSSGPDAVHLISLPAMQNFHIDDAGTSYEAALALHDQTCSNELDCSATFSFGGDFIDSGPLPAGAYAIVVDGLFGDSGAYQLNIGGTIAPHGVCTGPLATAGIIACPAGYSCLGGVCLGTLECNNGVDDDGDGKADYPEDPGCVDANDTTEIDDCPSGPNCPECGNGVDDDGDGGIDYGDDPECYSAAQDNEDLACPLEVDPVVMFTSGILTGTTAGAADNEHMSCDFGFGGPDIIATADLPAMQELKIDSIGTSFDDILALEDPTCMNELGCQDFGGPGGETVEVFGIPAGTYNIVMDGWDGNSGPYLMHLSGLIQPGGACDGVLATSGAITCSFGYACNGGLCTASQCNDGIDNDGDGFNGYPTDPGCANINDNSELDDCPSGPNCASCSNTLDDDGNGVADYPDDPSCIAAGGTEGTCGFDTDGVTNIVIPLYSGSTTGFTDDFDPSCFSGSASADRAFSITLPQPVSQLHVDTAGSSFYTVLSVTDSTCTGSLGCDIDSGGFGNSIVNLFGLSAGTYGIIVDGDFADGNFMLAVRGTVGSGDTCTGPLFSTGVLVCPANHICTGGTCQPLP